MSPPKKLHSIRPRDPELHQDEHEQPSRRKLLQTPLALLAGATSSIKVGPSQEAAKAITSTLDFLPIEEQLTVPLTWIPKLSAYIVYYSVGGDRVGGILDTGSPFLVVPNNCNRKSYGCYRPENSRPSGLESTVEQFDNNEGEVEWRKAPFSFVNATPGSSMMGPPEMIFGVLSPSLMDGSGGVFFGLIRDTDDWIRPSFLGQTNVRALEINLQDETSTTPQEPKAKTLTLYTRSPLRANPQSDYIPLTSDLNRKYGDPVIHYTAKAMSVEANGKPLTMPKDRTPVYVIFDTGVTGMVVSRELYDQRYTMARANREKSLWGSVSVKFKTKQGQVVSLEAQKPVTTPLNKIPWPRFKNAHLLVLGLAFLDGHNMIIDLDDQKLQIL